MDHFIGWRIIENVRNRRLSLIRIIGILGLKKERDSFRIKRQVGCHIDGKSTHYSLVDTWLN